MNWVGVFLEVPRVLRDDGTLWLNLGDSYMLVAEVVACRAFDYLAAAQIDLADRRAEAFLHRHLASDWRQIDFNVDRFGSPSVRLLAAGLVGVE